MPSMAARHTFGEHTGELEVRLEADSLPELYAEAGRALADVLAGPDAAAAGAWLEASATAPDRDALLVEWLNELLFLSEREKLAFPEIEIRRLSDTAVEGRVRGAEVAELRTAVKAATYHGVRVAEGPGGVSATVLLDI